LTGLRDFYREHAKTDDNQGHNPEADENKALIADHMKWQEPYQGGAMVHMKWHEREIY
jgi:hypothetical protein